VRKQRQDTYNNTKSVQMLVQIWGEKLVRKTIMVKMY
jgi:hypothetical protein